jgi:hypothetical protein
LALRSSACPNAGNGLKIRWKAHIGSNAVIVAELQVVWLISDRPGVLGLPGLQQITQITPDNSDWTAPFTPFTPFALDGDHLPKSSHPAAEQNQRDLHGNGGR